MHRLPGSNCLPQHPNTDHRGEGSFADTRRHALTARDIRFTTNGDVLCATVLARPQNGEVLVQSLASSLRLWTAEIETVTLLGSPAP
jgi:alpha-L-fucosidase